MDIRVLFAIALSLVLAVGSSVTVLAQAVTGNSSPPRAADTANDSAPTPWVQAAAVEDRITLHALNPLEDPPALLAANPLAKVPCLLLDDRTVLVDSPVICECLDRLAAAPVLVPAGGAARWDALRRQALADGILDLAVALRPEAQRSPEWQVRWRAGILRSVQRLAEERREWPPLDVGTIAVACALAYLDFRHSDLDWRSRASGLGVWLQAQEARPSFVETKAPQP